tara:strand:- start:222 stop:467 length:246 start_codon:yes stop_codon:yes gene_type:complete
MLRFNNILKNMINKSSSLNKNFLDQSKTSKNKKFNKTNKVDINILLNRVRQDKKKEKLESSLFFGLVLTAILTTGLVISFS